MTTAYDLVAYPTTVHASTNPERLAIGARLAGLDPAPIESARVLEIGGGSCLGLINFAATYPRSQCYGFDLSETAIAKGRKLAGSSCPNLTLAVDDIMTAAERLDPQSFDYVIAHGVYAWVPAPVREALLALIAHVLAPQGVAFVSYNSMPGGHIRRILRETLLHAISEVEGVKERVSAAHEALTAYSEPHEGDDPLMQGLRYHARLMLGRPASVVFHDEMGDCFEPQSLSDVVGAAKAAGLRYLTDAGPNTVYDGFLPRGAEDAANADAEVVKLAQMRDYLQMCWFRASLLVRFDAPLSRIMDIARTDGLYVSAPLEALENGEFRARNEDTVKIADPALVESLRDLAKAWPARRPIAEVAPKSIQREELMWLFRRHEIMFHTAPAPFAMELAERPVAYHWLRAMLTAGEVEVVSLAHRVSRIEQPEMRALLIAADGTRSLAELCAADHGFPSDQVEAALGYAASQGMLQR